MFKVVTLDEYRSVDNEVHYDTMEEAIAGVASEVSTGTPEEYVELWERVPIKITVKVEVIVQ